MIIREKYLEKIRGFYDCDLVKVIQGVRRSGKSTILESIKTEISGKTDNIIYLNFEKIQDTINITNYLDLIKYVNSNKKEGLCYCFFDEIQEIPNWHIAVKDLRLNNCSLFITGSNSKLLSSEFIDNLSGRFVCFNVYPFVYKEILKYSNELKYTPSISDYLIWGGFPKRFEFNNLDDQIQYLNDINNTIINNDIIKRFNIRNNVLFNKVVNYVLKSNSRIFSSKSIYDYIKNEHYECSVNTITNYIQYLKNAFIICEVPKYSTRAKKELTYFGKLYNTDVSFNSLRNISGRFDIEHNLENIIYNELIYMGYNVQYYSTPDYEIDFKCTKNNKTYFIQVCYTLVNEDTYKREMKGFNRLDNLNQKIIISNDDVDFSTSTVKHIKLKDFLLLNDLD